MELYQNRLIVTGKPAVINLVLAGIKSNKNLFDFEKVTGPCPQALIGISSESIYSFLVYEYRHGNIMQELKILHKAQAPNLELDDYMDRLDGSISNKEGKRMRELYKEFGVFDEYGWKLNNWGTTSNSSDAVIESNGVIRFNTIGRPLDNKGNIANILRDRFKHAGISIKMVYALEI